MKNRPGIYYLEQFWIKSLHWITPDIIFLFQLEIKGVQYPSYKKLDFYVKKDVMITASSSVKDEQFLGSTAMQKSNTTIGFQENNS